MASSNNKSGSVNLDLNWIGVMVSSCPVTFIMIPFYL